MQPTQPTRSQQTEADAHEGESPEEFHREPAVLCQGCSEPLTGCEADAHFCRGDERMYLCELCRENGDLHYPPCGYIEDDPREDR